MARGHGRNSSRFQQYLNERNPAAAARVGIAIVRKTANSRSTPQRNHVA
jgi:hypothetical protein